MSITEHYIPFTMVYARSVDSTRSIRLNDVCYSLYFFFFSSRRRHTRSDRDWSSDVCFSDLFYPPDDVQARKPERELQVAAAEGQWAEEGWRVRKDGSRFWASVVITALRSADGELLGFGKVTRDVTERHVMEQALRETERRFHLIVEGAKEYALLMLDPGGRGGSWDAGAERLKGDRAAGSVGQHSFPGFPP